MAFTRILLNLYDRQLLPIIYKLTSKNEVVLEIDLIKAQKQVEHQSKKLKSLENEKIELKNLISIMEEEIKEIKNKYLGLNSQLLDEQLINIEKKNDDYAIYLVLSYLNSHNLIKNFMSIIKKSEDSNHLFRKQDTLVQKMKLCGVFEISEIPDQKDEIQIKLTVRGQAILTRINKNDIPSIVI